MAGSPSDAKLREEFIAKGYVVLRGCFSKDDAEPWLAEARKRAAAERKKSKEDVLSLPWTASMPVSQLAPKAWAAVCELSGGEERIDPKGRTWSDGFLVNHAAGARRPKGAPESRGRVWRKEGDRKAPHFLDGAEAGVLAVSFWSDAGPGSGGLLAAVDSLPLVARYLAERPAGAGAARLKNRVHGCRQFVELTGKTGDVALLHPFLLFTEADNRSGKPSFLGLAQAALAELPRFDRKDPKQFSPLERATLRALGVERRVFRRAR